MFNFTTSNYNSGSKHSSILLDFCGIGRPDSSHGNENQNADFERRIGRISFRKSRSRNYYQELKKQQRGAAAAFDIRLPTLTLEAFPVVATAVQSWILLQYFTNVPDISSNEKRFRVEMQTIVVRLLTDFHAQTLKH